jgi:toxin ParE1/3/4
VDWEVKWTEASWNDLEEVAEYISSDSPFYAAAFIEEVQEASRSLSYLVERGRVVPELNRSDIREIFVRNYRMIYQLSKQIIFIIGFIQALAISG